MFQITDKQFGANSYGPQHHFHNWPMLYILENGRKAYIGESNDVTTRMSQHKNTRDKKIFKDVHFIYSYEFNKSVTLDFESQLIQLMAADETFILTNDNRGIANKDYYNKEYYDNYFPNLWNQLRAKKLVRKNIAEIKNSDLFKYSPYKELTDDQRTAVDAIFDSLQNNCRHPIIVQGMPGSGKTIVAVFLFKYLRDYTDEQGNAPYRHKKIGIVIPQTSLRATIKTLFSHIDGLKASEVLGPSDVTKERYDILLVDEAHRLHQRKNIPNMGSHDGNNQKLNLPQNATELDWIFHQTDCPILFYDSDQVVGPSGISMELMSRTMNQRFRNRMVTYHTLTSQMRVKGGSNYIKYIKDLLHNNLTKKQSFPGYDLKIVDSFADFEQLLTEKESAVNLCRMVAGYAWPWKSKKDKSIKDIRIENSERMWNNRTKNWVHSETALEEVGCIHSIQGYDLNYAFVILGNDIKYDTENKKVVIDKSNYFDRNGKATATEEELDTYIKNIYYVLLTRGIRGTYLYICDPALKKYMEQFIDTWS